MVYRKTDSVEARLADNRKRILAAARTLVSEGGWPEAQVSNVAAAAGLATGTVYRYFNSKERLLLEMMAEQQEDLRRYLQSHAVPGATAALRVTNVLRRANGALRRYPDVTVAMVRAFGASREENADLVERVGEIMNSIIVTAIGTDSPRNHKVARVITQVWLSSLIGFAGGVDPLERVDEDLGIATGLLLGDD